MQTRTLRQAILVTPEKSGLMTERDREGAREGQGDRWLKLYPVARDKGDEAGKGTTT